MANFPEQVGGWLLDLAAFVGLALGGAQAAASGVINELQQDSLRQAAMNNLLDTSFSSRGKVLTPASLAEGVVKGAIPRDEAADEATYSGVRGDRFDALVAITGNPPGVGELITMWRRGIIGPDDVTRGIRQGYIKTEWAPFLAQLLFDPLTPGEAVQAAVQNHMPYGDAKAEAAKSGVSLADFDIMYANAGNPPGPMELLNLWVRGYINESDVDQGLRESRLKDKWIPALKNLAVRKVPLRTINTLLTHGAITDAQATQHLRELGYSVDDAAALVAAAHFQKTAAPRELSVAAIKALYAQHVITKEQAAADLVTLRYTAEQADQLLTLAEGESLAALRKATINRVRSRFVAHHIDRLQASKDLDALNVDSKQRDAMLTLWELELAENARGLTEAQIVRAGKMELIPVDDMLQRLSDLGYSDGDAVLLATIGGAIAPPPKQPGG